MKQRRAEDSDAAIAQLRACLNGTGPLLTTHYQLMLVDLIERELGLYRESEAARYLEAAAHALAVLDGVGIGDGQFEPDDGRAAGEAADILREVIDT